jgi:hypothetical protein
VNMVLELPAYVCPSCSQPSQRAYAKSLCKSCYQKSYKATYEKGSPDKRKRRDGRILQAENAAEHKPETTPWCRDLANHWGSMPIRVAITETAEA